MVAFENQPAPMSPRDIPRALWRHRAKSFWLFVTVMLLATGVFFFAPPQYVSDAKLFVRLGRESVGLDPTATTGQTISVLDNREIEVNSIIEVLNSRALIERVLDRLGVAAIINDTHLLIPLPPSGGESPAPGQLEVRAASPFGDASAAPGQAADTRLKTDDPAGDKSTTEQVARGESTRGAVDVAAAAATRLASSGGPQDDPRTREKAITALANSLKIWAPKKTRVICVRCNAGTPQLAQRVVQTLVDAYLEEHVRVHRTPGSYDFFVHQSDILKDQWQTAADDLRKMKNEVGLNEIGGRKDLLQKQLADLEAQHLRTGSDLSAAEALNTSLAAAIAALPEKLITQEVSGVGNLGTDSMRQTLYALQIQERELGSKLTDNHPQLIAVRQQLAEAQKILDKQQPERVESTSATNPSRQKLELSLLESQSQTAAHQARAAALRDQVARTLEDIQRLNYHEVELASLQRKVDLAERNYRAYAEKLEQARVNHELESERITNVTVQQPASFVAKPTFPQGSVVFGLGLVAAVVSAFGLAVCAEYFDTSLRTTEQVEQQVRLPVLLSIPRIEERGGVLLN